MNRILVMLMLWGVWGCQITPDEAESAAGLNAERASGPKSQVLGSSAQALLATTEPTEGPVQIQLVSEKTAIVPGRPLDVGLWIRHDPGYHTYWRFPGVIGLPTDLRWNLPDGFRAGPIRWAHPQKTKMAVYTVWGYEKPTLLITRIHVPENLKPGRMVEIRADARWMACARDCHPGFQSFYLRIPVARTASDHAPWAERFNRTRDLWARTTDAWTFHAEKTPTGYRLIGTPGPGARSDPGRIYFFNANRQIDSNTTQDFEKRADGSILLEMKRWEHASAAEHLEGIVRSSRGWERNRDLRSIRIRAPITKKSSAAQPPSDRS